MMLIEMFRKEELRWLNLEEFWMKITDYYGMLRIECYGWIDIKMPLPKKFILNQWVLMNRKPPRMLIPLPHWVFPVFKKFRTNMLNEMMNSWEKLLMLLKDWNLLWMTKIPIKIQKLTLLNPFEVEEVEKERKEEKIEEQEDTLDMSRMKK